MSLSAANAESRYYYNISSDDGRPPGEDVPSMLKQGFSLALPGNFLDVVANTVGVGKPCGFPLSTTFRNMAKMSRKADCPSVFYRFRTRLRTVGTRYEVEMAQQQLKPEMAIRLEVEDFLYHEASLLDQWKLDDWLELFTADARYLVPTTDLPEGDPEIHGDQLVFIDDDISRLRGRVTRLKSRHAHREYPWSRTRRSITNVRVIKVDGDEISVTATFTVYRIRGGQAAAYVGRYDYLLRRVNGELRIVFRRAVLDHESLTDTAAVSIVL